MALGRTYSIALVGLNGYVVEVEADIGQTMSSKRHMRTRAMLVLQYRPLAEGMTA